MRCIQIILIKIYIKYIYVYLGIFKKITSQHASIFSFILHQHVHLIARYEANILLRLKRNIHRIMDLLFSFICLTEAIKEEIEVKEKATNNVKPKEYEIKEKPATK